MTWVKRILTISAREVNEYREEYGCGLHEARKALAKHKLLRVLPKVETPQDLAECMEFQIRMGLI